MATPTRRSKPTRRTVSAAISKGKTLFDLLDTVPRTRAETAAQAVERILAARQDEVAKLDAETLPEDSPLFLPPGPMMPGTRPTLTRSSSSPAIVSSMDSPTSAAPKIVQAGDPVSMRLDHSALLKPRSNVLETTLDNGLKVALVESKMPPKRVALRLIVHAGSMHETEDQLGVAHILEHLAFRSTKSFETGHIVELLESVGASYGADVNARTMFDSTQYDLMLPTDNRKLLELGCMIMSEWAQHIRITPEALAAERTVVLEEWREHSSPEINSKEPLTTRLYAGTPLAARDPIGTEERIKNVTVDRVRAFYRDHYQLNRMMLIAVGDFPHGMKEFLALAYKHFGSLRPKQVMSAGLPDPYADLRLQPIVVNNYNQFVVRGELMDTARVTVNLGFLYEEAASNSVGKLYQTMINTLLLLMMQSRFQQLVKCDHVLDVDVSSTGFVVRGIQQVAITLTPSAKPGDLEQTFRLAVSEIKRLNDVGFTEAEFTTVIGMISHLLTDLELWTPNTMEWLSSLTDYDAGLETNIDKSVEGIRGRQLLKEATVDDIHACLRKNACLDQARFDVFVFRSDPEKPSPLEGILTPATMEAMAKEVMAAANEEFVSEELVSCDPIAVATTRLEAMAAVGLKPAALPTNAAMSGDESGLDVTMQMPNGLLLNLTHAPVTFDAENDQSGGGSGMFRLSLQPHMGYGGESFLRAMGYPSQTTQHFAVFNTAVGVPCAGFAGFSPAELASVASDHLVMISAPEVKPEHMSLTLQTMSTGIEISIAMLMLLMTTPPEACFVEKDTLVKVADNIYANILKEDPPLGRRMLANARSCAHLYPKIMHMYLQNPKELVLTIQGNFGTTVEDIGTNVRKTYEDLWKYLSPIPPLADDIPTRFQGLMQSFCSACGSMDMLKAVKCNWCPVRYCCAACKSEAATSHAQECLAVPQDDREDEYFGPGVQHNVVFSQDDESGGVLLTFPFRVSMEERWICNLTAALIQSRVLSYIRQKLGLTYNAIANVTYPAEGTFGVLRIQIQCSPENAELVLSRTMRLVRYLRQKGPSSTACQQATSTMFHQLETNASDRTTVMNYDSSRTAAAARDDYVKNVAMKLRAVTPEMIKKAIEVMTCLGAVTPRYATCIFLPRSMKEAHTTAVASHRRLRTLAAGVLFAVVAGVGKLLG